MNLRQEILKEKMYTKDQALTVSDYACSTPGRFKQLMECFLSNEYRLAQRAAWSVSWATRKKPALIKPYIKDLVIQLQRKDAHDAVIRNSVRILQQIDIPASLHGELMNTCFGFIGSNSAPPAIKAFSLTVLSNLAKFYPDIIHELKLIIEERWNHETAAFKSRGGKILKAFAGNKSAN